MNKIPLFKVSLLLLFFAATLKAETIKLPKDKPTVSVTIPDSWKPEETNEGYSSESPDQAATLVFETSPADKINDLIDANIDWLMKEQKVAIDKSTEKKDDFTQAGLDWKTLKWDGKDDVYGPATIMLAFAHAGNGQIILITYWVTKTGEKEHAGELTKILDSVQKIGE